MAVAVVTAAAAVAAVVAAVAVVVAVVVLVVARGAAKPLSSRSAAHTSAPSSWTASGDLIVGTLAYTVAAGSKARGSGSCRGSPPPPRRAEGQA